MYRLKISARNYAEKEKKILRSASNVEKIDF